MAIFLPTYDQTSFVSEAEHGLHQLFAALSDDFTVIHSCPWLRSTAKRIFSKEMHRYINLFRNERTNVTGEIDFIIAHPKYGLLCIEAKGGEYRQHGSKFVHVYSNNTIDPLEQVKDNAFTVINLIKERHIQCPVGYAIYLDSSSIDTTNLHPGLAPIGASKLADGILILKQHEHRIAERIVELFDFWSNTSDFAGRGDFGKEVDKFVNTVWPKEALNDSIGRKIAFDEQVWLKFDASQHRIVKACMTNEKVLVAGFAGTGKTLLASATAISHAETGRRVLYLLKNRKIAAHLAEEFSKNHLSKWIEVSTFHAYCDAVGSDGNFKSEEFATLHRYLLTRNNLEIDCLIVDEAQGLTGC